MFFKKVSSILLILGMAITLISCKSLMPAINGNTVVDLQDAAQEDLNDQYQQLAKTRGTLFTIDPPNSIVRIYVFRSGRAANLGHNHVLSAPKFTGFFYLPTDGTIKARFDLVFRLDQLEIDNPEIRATLGKAFSGKLTSEAINGTRENMLGDNNLQANQYPLVRIHSLQISGETPKFPTKIQIEMHGQKREMWVPLNVNGLPDQLSVSGSVVLRQSDFGIQPFSVMGGLLAIQDEIIVEFELTGKLK